MAILLGLIAAIAWGTGDFTGGLAARKAPETAVVLGTESFGLVLLLGCAFFVGGSPTARDLTFGAGAGLVGVAGLVLLYRGLAQGRASVVAPLSAVGACILQVTWGLGRGETPGVLALIGIVLAIVSIGVVAGSAAEPADVSTLSRRQEIQCGLGAAIGFGFYLILISETSHGAGLWTAVAARAAPVLLLLVVLSIMRRPVTVPRDAIHWVAISGFTDAGANALLVAAVRTGLLSVVAPVANLFPAVTVLLARAVGHETIGRFRLTGLALAVVSLVLIAL